MGSRCRTRAVRHVRREAGSGVWGALVAGLLALTTTACTTTKHFASVQSLQPPAQTGLSDIKIALMPLDIELSVLTAGGLAAPHAAWTQAARMHLLGAFSQIEQTRGKEILRYERPESGEPLAATLNEIEHLHGAVGNAIIVHKLFIPLPSKRNKFDWSLGPDVAVLRARTQADYALFIFIRDSYSSAGRVFAQIAAAALGIGLAGGQQLGFASLVDLTSGDIVWFNFLQSATGDLRDAAGANETLTHLLDGMPQ